jgi:dipeptidase E
MAESARAETPASGQIVAIGGMDLSPTGDVALLRYLRELTGKERPRACYVPTASSEHLDHVVSFYNTAARIDLVASHLSLFQPPTADLRGYLLENDLIFVGGGNTKSLLALWREWELDAILREAWERGIVLAGVSAGAICWFEQGITDSIPGPLTPLACLGYLPGSMCPHYDGEAERRPSFHRMLAGGVIAPAYAAEDGVGLHFVGIRLKRVVTSRPGKAAYRLELADDGAVREERMEVEAL